MRNELFHPLVSHLPLVFLGLFPLVALFVLFLKEPIKGHLQFLKRVFLYGGLLGLFASIYLGDMALERVSSSVCSLTLVYQHEEQAYFMLYATLVLIALDVVLFVKKEIKELFILAPQIIIGFLLLFFVYQTGHSGAELVYEYGTAVKNATCP